jgi:ribosomal protein S18 acetylase RimI-like enzyme
MTAEPKITAARPDDRRRVIDTLVLAFAADPAVRRNLYPDPSQYTTHFAPFAEAFGGEAFARGTADFLEDGSGAALWLPPDVHPDEEPLMDLLRKTVEPAQQAETFRIFEEMAAYHPKEPHWYLPLIGVDPWHHRRGLGSRLMDHALRRCDRDHAPAYLESSNPSNVPFYERHGFALLGTIRVGSTEPMFPMLRRPR